MKSLDEIFGKTNTGTPQPTTKTTTTGSTGSKKSLDDIFGADTKSSTPVHMQPLTQTQGITQKEFEKQQRKEIPLYKRVLGTTKDIVTGVPKVAKNILDVPFTKEGREQFAISFVEGGIPSIKSVVTNYNDLFWGGAERLFDKLGADILKKEATTAKLQNRSMAEKANKEVRNFLDQYALTYGNVNDDRNFWQKISSKDGEEEVAKVIGMQLPTFMSLFASSAMTGGSLPVILTTSFALNSGDAYQQGKDYLESQGIVMTPEWERKLSKTAGLTGLMTAPLDAYGLDRIMTPSKYVVFKKAFMNNVVNTVIDTGVDAVIESGTESAQEIIQNAWAKTYNENQNLFEGVPEALFTGGLFAGGASTLVNVTSVLKPKITKPQTISDTTFDIPEVDKLAPDIKTELDSIVKEADMTAVDPKAKLAIEEIAHSEGMSIEKTIAEDPSTEPMFYQNREQGILTENYAQQRVNDVAQKLAKYDQTLADQYRSAIDLKNTTYENIVNTGLELIKSKMIENQEYARSVTTGEKIPAGSISFVYGSPTMMSAGAMRRLKEGKTPDEVVDEILKTAEEAGIDYTEEQARDVVDEAQQGYNEIVSEIEERLQAGETIPEIALSMIDRGGSYDDVVATIQRIADQQGITPRQGTDVVSIGQEAIQNVSQITKPTPLEDLERGIEEVFAGIKPTEEIVIPEAKTKKEAQPVQPKPAEPAEKGEAEVAPAEIKIEKPQTKEEVTRETKPAEVSPEVTVELMKQKPVAREVEAKKVQPRTLSELIKSVETEDQYLSALRENQLFNQENAEAIERGEIERRPDFTDVQRESFQDVIKRDINQKGFVTTEQALEEALQIPIFKELASRGQVVLSEQLSNPKAFGSYYNGVIKFIKDPHNTTLPHEAFHAFADMALTTQEKADALDLVREPGMSDLQAEEKMAQDFAEWYVAQNKKTKLQKFFEKILAFFNKLLGYENEIRSIYNRVLSKSTVEKIKSFQEKGGISQLKKEYNQDPQEFTIELFTFPEVWKKETVKRATVISALGRLKKPLMKDYVAKKLDTEFKGQDIINTGELKRSILADLLDMRVLERTTYADYGLDNIGIGSGIDAKTYIVNTNFKHGVMGHFTGDFDIKTTKDDLEIRKIDAGTYDVEGQTQTVKQDQYFVVRKDLSRENIEAGTLAKFNTEKEAEAYIENFADRRVSQPGLFGHFRAFLGGYPTVDTFNVVEIQSDTFQKDMDRFARSNERRMRNEIAEVEKVKTENEEDLARQKIKLEGYLKEPETFAGIIASSKDKIATIEKNIAIQEKKIADIKKKYAGKEGQYFRNIAEIDFNESENILKDDISPFIKNVENNPDKFDVNENIRFLESGINKLKRKGLIEDKDYIVTLWSSFTESLQDRTVDLSSFNLQTVEPLLENNTEYGYKNKQIIKDVLVEIEKEARANLAKVKKQIKEITPEQRKEIELSEQYLSFKNNYHELLIKTAIRQGAMSGAKTIRFATPYTVANVEGYISTQGDWTADGRMVGEYRPGDLSVGERIEHLGYDAIVAEVDDEGYRVIWAESRDKLNEYREDDIIDGERNAWYDDFNDRADFDTVKETSENFLKNRLENKKLNKEEYEVELLKLEEAEEISDLEDLTVFEDVKEQIIDLAMIDFDTEDFMEGLYGRNGYASYEVNGTRYFVDNAGGDVNEESLGFTTEFVGNAEDFKLSDIDNEETRTIASKYGVDENGKEGEFYKFLKKNRPDLKEVKDDNGFTWYETEVTPQDKASVEMFQVLPEKKLTITDELKEKVSEELSILDTIPLTVNGRPFLVNTDEYFRLDQLQQILNKRALTRNEVIETIDLMQKIGIEIVPGEKFQILDPVNNEAEEEARRMFREASYNADVEEIIDDMPEDTELETLLEQKIFAVENLKEAIDLHPAKPFAKYVSTRGEFKGELAEVGTGKDSYWSKNGDWLANDAGYEDSESAREGYQEYVELRKELAIKQQILKEVRDKVREFKKKGKADEAFVKSIKDDIYKKLTGKMFTFVQYEKAKAKAESKGLKLGEISGRKDLRLKQKIARRRAERIRAIKKIYLKTRKALKTGRYLSVDYQRKLRDFFENYSFQKMTSKTKNKLESMRDFFATQGDDISDNIALKLARLDKIQIGDMTDEQLAELHGVVQHIFNLGVVKKRLQDSLNEEKLQQLKNKIVASSVNLDNKRSLVSEGLRKLGMDEGKIIAFRKGNLDTFEAFRVADMIDGIKNYKGANYTEIQKPMADAIGEAERISEEIITRNFDQISELGQFTKDEERRMYYTSALEQGAETQAKEFRAYHETTNKTDFEKPLTLKEKQALDIVVNTFKEIREFVAPVYEMIKNRPFPDLDRYTPLKYSRDLNTVNIDETFDFTISKTKDGFTLERKPMVNKILNDDFFDSMLRSAYEQMYYAKVQPELERTKAIVNSYDYQKATGVLANKFWKTWIEDISTKGHSGGFLDKIRSNISMATLGYKLSTIIIQPLALIDAMSTSINEFGVPTTLKLLPNFVKMISSPRLMKFMQEESTSLYERSGGQVEIQELREVQTGKLSGKKLKEFYAKYKKYAFKGIQYTDLATASAVFKAFKENLLKQGLTEQEATKRAETLMKLTQASSNIADRPHLLNTNTGRAVLTFQTFVTNAFNNIRYDLIQSNITRKGALAGSTAMILAMAFIVSARMAEQEFRDFWYKLFYGGEPDKEEDLIKKIWAGFITNIPILNNFFDWDGNFLLASDKLIKNPIVDVMQKGFKAVDKMIKGEFTGNVITQFLNSAFSLAGVPGTSQFNQLLRSRFNPYIDEMGISYLKNKEKIEKTIKKNIDKPITKDLIQGMAKDIFKEDYTDASLSSQANKELDLIKEMTFRKKYGYDDPFINAFIEAENNTERKAYFIKEVQKDRSSAKSYLSKLTKEEKVLGQEFALINGRGKEQPYVGFAKELNAIAGASDKVLVVLDKIASSKNDIEKKKYIQEFSDDRATQKQFAKKLYADYKLISKQLYESI